MSLDFMPETAIEALDRWDKNQILWSVEMGGLGPSYEQCIQFSTFEIIRELNGIAPNGKEQTINKKLDKVLGEINKRFNLGHSGATAGASKWLAYKYMKNGFKKSLESAPKNRLIQINKNFSKGD